MAYFATLMAEALSRDMQPVLGFTRSLGRLLAMKRRFRAASHLPIRNLVDQWMSYLTHRESGRPYFIDTVGMIIAANLHDPVLAQINKRFPTSADAFPALDWTSAAHAAEAVDVVLPVSYLAASRLKISTG